MNAKSDPAANDSTAQPASQPSRLLVRPVVAGLASWVAISLGFLGLRMLMQQRPEFVGRPMTVAKAELVQESPQIVMRKVTDDISVIKATQPESSEVCFDMRGRRDYRGLRTLMDMSGEFRGQYVLTNIFEEPVFVLFKCPHPRTQSGSGQSLLASSLRLQASPAGVQENAKDAWFWTGTLEAHGSAAIEISYQVASLKEVAYRVGEQNGNPVRQLRVTFRRRDLPAMRFESGDGTKVGSEAAVVWERRDFLAPDFFSAGIEESRSLYVSLSQLLEIGPLVCLLFLLSVSAIVLARQHLTAIQMVTIAAGYALYFPLILYLSSRFAFAVALVISVVVPGALLVNYARWLLGVKLGLFGGPLLLGLYQVFPTLAAFAGWNRGMVLLCLGVVTLWVLINLQNQALKRRATMAAVLVAWCVFPCHLRGGEIQILLPGELAGRLLEPKRETPEALIAFEPAEYRARQEASHFRVEARVSFQVLRAGETPVPLLGAPVHLQESQVEPVEPEPFRVVSVSNRLSLLVQRPGQGTLRLSYRVPIENREGKKRAQVPLLLGSSGSVRLESARSDLEIVTGSLWSRSLADAISVYDIGVAGDDRLVIEWREQGGDSLGGPGTPGEGSKEFYGIGLTRAQNLTVINSDGSCTHFAEFELPVFRATEFRLRIPANARLISVSVNGAEISSPAVEDRLCRIPLPSRETQQPTHRLSFRIAYPMVRLGFAGTAELTLPEVFQTAGMLEWVVALPNGFDTQIISSGLEAQKGAPDLGRFGDYGRILGTHPHTYLAKDLAPPGLVSLSLKYRQVVPGFYELRPQ